MRKLSFDASNPLCQGPVTLVQLAKIAGVSHTTVSRALRHDPQISAKRRAEIQALAQKWDYRADPMVSALISYRNRTREKKFQSVIGWINAWSKPEKLYSYRLFADYLRGAKDAAARMGYAIEEFLISENMPARRLETVLKARGIRGLLLPPHLDEGIVFADFDFTDFAVIRLGYSLRWPQVSRVCGSQTSDVLAALKAMRGQGYQRIGYATSAALRSRSILDAGFLKYHADGGARDFSMMLVLPDAAQPTKKVTDLIRRWMHRNRPDAILTTEGNMKALLAGAGYRVPDDVALAATTVTDCDADTGIDQNGEEIGRVAALNLGTLLQNNYHGIPMHPQDILVHGTWVQGQDLPVKSPIRLQM